VWQCCLFALDQVVNGGNYFIALELNIAPQNSNIFSTPG
jgi:hypothetical protein